MRQIDLFSESQLNKHEPANSVLVDIIRSSYNERPTDRPNCPNCKKRLSPAGGTLDGKEMFWACWDCGYRQEDIPCIVYNGFGLGLQCEERALRQTRVTGWH